MSLIVVKNESCIEQDVDIIVNAANKNLLQGGGVCGAIFKEAGYKELTESCMKIKTPLKDGEVAITPAFNIKNAKFIIHAVGPNFAITPNAFNELFNAYYNSLLLMKDNNLHSISFPLISAGIFSGNLNNPAFVSSSQCKKAYNKFINNFPNYDIKVILCAYSKDEYDISYKTIEEDIQ